MSVLPWLLIVALAVVGGFYVVRVGKASIKREKDRVAQRRSQTD